MKGINFFKKVKLYIEYRKLIKKNQDKIKKLGLEEDYIGRLYTVVNMPEDGKKYGEKLRSKYLTDYIKDCDVTFKEVGLSEFVGIYYMDKIDEVNYLVIFSYSQFNVVKFWRRIIATFLLLTAITTYILLK